MTQYFPKVIYNTHFLFLARQHGEILSPSVGIHRKQLGAGVVVVFGGLGCVPGDRNGFAGDDIRFHIAVRVLHLGGPLNGVRAILVVALGRYVVKSDFAVVRVVSARPRLKKQQETRKKRQ